jgi:putative glutamine amidotransferase
MSSRIRIGVTANFFHADPERKVFRHKTLQYLEERMALALARAGAVPVLLPDLKDEAGTDALLDVVDGIALAGGADVSPLSYGAAPLRPEWSGDKVRDEYEIRLIRRAAERGMPVLGVCRGIQVLNVALGGTLWQDIGTQVEGALVHRDWQRYDETGHAISIDADSWIARVYAGASTLDVNSVHHQGIRDLAPVLRATAWAPDGIIEAAECIDARRFFVGVQWHPEWLEAERVATDRTAAGRTAGDAIFAAFATECRTRHVAAGARES